MAAEYVAKEGNERIILCERGIRTFERSTRFTLDIGAIPVLKAETHLPVIVDPSHAAGKRPAGRAAGARRRRRRRRRPDRRDAPEPRARALRRGPADPERQFARVRARDRVVPRRGRQDPLPVARAADRLAVVGLGLMGGSLGLAARERAGADGRRLRPRPGRARGRASSAAASTTAHDDLRGGRATAPSWSCVCAPVAAAAGGGRRGARRRAAGDRHRHRLDQGAASSRRSCGSRPRPLRRRPPGLRARGARRRSTPAPDLFDGATWFLTPVADTDPRALPRPARVRRLARRDAGGDRPGRARPPASRSRATCRTCSRTCSSTRPAPAASTDTTRSRRSAAASAT